MSRSDEPRERQFNPIGALEDNEDVGVQPGYIDFSHGWESRVSDEDLPSNTWDELSDDRVPAQNSPAVDLMAGYIKNKSKNNEQ